METKKALERLKNLKNAIGTKSSDTGEDCLHFYKNRIIAAKEDIIISTKNIFGITGSFPAKDIIRGLEVIKAEEVLFSISDYGNLVITSDNSKIQISSHEKAFEYNYSVYDKVKVKNWINLPDGFMSGLMMCAETSSREIRDGEVACVAIRSGSVEATDNIRASVFFNDLRLEEDIFLLGMNVKKIPDFCDQINVDESLVHFKSGSFVYSLPRLEVDFPYITEAVESWIPKNRDNIVFPKELITLAKDLEHFCGGDYDAEKTVKITFTAKDIKCSAKKETASITKKIPNTTHKKKGFFKINPFMLSSLIKDHDEVFINDDKIFFIRKDFIHVIGM